jgi:hypothetical protein
MKTSVLSFTVNKTFVSCTELLELWEQCAAVTSRSDRALSGGSAGKQREVCSTSHWPIAEVSIICRYLDFPYSVSNITGRNLCGLLKTHRKQLGCHLRQEKIVLMMLNSQHEEIITRSCFITN